MAAISILAGFDKTQIRCHLLSCPHHSVDKYQTGAYNSKRLRPRQKGCHFACDVVNMMIFWLDNFCISILISTKFVPIIPNNKRPALIQITTWRWTGDKPLSGPIKAECTDAYMFYSAAMTWHIDTVTKWLIYCNLCIFSSNAFVIRHISIASSIDDLILIKSLRTNLSWILWAVMIFIVYLHLIISTAKWG